MLQRRTAALLLLVLASVLLASTAYADPGVFSLEGYTFLSRARGPVYPGSKGAQLELSFTYNGTSTATGVHGCVESAPAGFKFHQACVQAVDESGEALSTIEPGGFFKLRFGLDVDRSVKPGTYEITVRVAGYAAGSRVEETFRVSVEVHAYPALALKVLEARLEPFSSPGSREVSLVLTVENEGNTTVSGGKARLLVPEGFHPNETEVDLPAIGPGSRASIEFRGLSISPDTEPGNYTFKILVNATMRTEDDVEYYESAELEVNLTVSPIESMKLELVDYGWASGKAYTTSKSLSLRVALKNLEDARIVGYTAKLRLPPGFEAADGGREIVLCSGQADVGYQDVLTLSFEGIDAVDVKEGNYTFGLYVLLHVAESGAETLKKYEANLTVKVLAPKLKLKVVDYGWSPGFALNVTRGGTVYVTLQNLGLDTVTSLTARLKLLNAVSREGTRVIEASTETRMAHGALVTLRFPGVVAEGVSEIVCELEVEAVVSTQAGSTYTASWSARLRIPLVAERPLVIDEAHVEYAGRPSPVLPTARDLTLLVRVANEMPTRISSLSFVVVGAPSWMSVKSLEGCSEGLAPGSTCVLRITFDVSESAERGIYLLKLLARFRYTPSEGGVEVGEQLLSVPVIVADPKDYAPRVEVLAVYWGAEARPSRPYAGASLWPLTVRLLNLGRYDASAVTVYVAAEGWSRVVGGPVAIGRLSAYSSATATVYLDLSESKPGRHGVKVVVRWAFTEFGTRLIFEEAKTAEVRVEHYEGEGVHVVTYGWSNDWPVYPGTKGAELRVVVANKEPFDLTWLEAELRLPKGFAAHEPASLRAYASHVRSGDTAVLTFKLDVSNETKPGAYEAKLVIKYAMSAGDLLVVRNVTESVLLTVESPECFELVSSEWVGGSPAPGTRGAVLRLVVRYLCKHPIAVPVAKLYLPPGFESAFTGTSVATAAPSVGSPAQPRTLPSEGYEKYLRMLMGVAPPPEAEGPTFLVYDFKLNVGNVTPGVYKSMLKLSFVDPWGSKHATELPLTLVVSGAPKAIEAWTEPIQVIRGGVGTLRLYLRNLGTTSMYNVYVAVIPQTPNVAVMDSVKYLEELKPGEPAALNFTVLLAVQGGSLISRTASFLVTVTYQDPTGALRTFNTTVAVIIAPFIKLELRDVKAEYRAGVLHVSGSVINLGSSVAYRVAVYASSEGASSYAMLGDIDPGSEVPFRLSLKPPKTPWQVVLTLAYYDEYDREFVVNRTLAVHHIIERVTTTPKAPSLPISEMVSSGALTYIVVVALVAVFLSVALYLVYRVVKRHEKALEAMSGGGSEA